MKSVIKMDETIKEIIIKEDNSSIELHEDAKGQLKYTVKIYFNANEQIENIIEKVNKIKDAIEKEVLKR